MCGEDLLSRAGAGPGNFSQEDLLQLISTGGEGPGGAHQGFLDPVFVDHEESQNAADLDQIVFEDGEEVGEGEDDFLNDPRLGTICSGSNSLGNSERGEIAKMRDSPFCQNLPKLLLLNCFEFSHSYFIGIF